MKKALNTGVIILTVVFIMVSSGFAANRQGKGAGDGTGPIHDIFAGEPFTLAGTVITMAPGLGIELFTGDTTVTIYGIGPIWYWETLEVDRPAVGDEISVSGYIVNYDGEIRYIATAVEFRGISVELRDDGGQPLWSGGNRRPAGF